MSDKMPLPCPWHGFPAALSNRGSSGPTRQLTTWCRCSVTSCNVSYFAANPAWVIAVLSSPARPVSAARIPWAPSARTATTASPSTPHRTLRIVSLRIDSDVGLPNRDEAYPAIITIVSLTLGFVLLTFGSHHLPSSR